MDQRHFDERVGVEFIAAIDEALKVAHQRDDGLGILWGGVHCPAGAIFQRGARQLAESRVVLLQLSLNLNDVVTDEQTALLHQIEPDPQYLTV